MTDSGGRKVTSTREQSKKCGETGMNETRQQVQEMALTIPDFEARRGKNPTANLHRNTNQEATL